MERNYESDIKKFSFSQRCVEVWNGLDKSLKQNQLINTKCWICIDMETGEHKDSSSCMLQLGKYTHKGAFLA